METIIQNAQNMESTRVDGPPAPELSYNEQQAQAAAARETARVAALSPVDREIESIRANPKFLANGDPEQRALVQRLQQLIVQQTSPEESKNWSELPLAKQREVYGLEHPALIPATFTEAYEAEFGWAESELITVSRNMGLSSSTVRALRDAGVQLGLQIDGAPLPDDVVIAKFGRIAGLTERQRAQFVALYRQVEGGGAT